MRTLLLLTLAACGSSSPPPPSTPPAAPPASTAEPAQTETTPAAPGPAAEPASPTTVNKAKAEACNKLLDAYKADAAAQQRHEPLVELARCYYDANALSASIATWKLVESKFAREAGQEAALGLATAYDRAVELDPTYADLAAEAHTRYAKKYGGKRPEAIQHLETALCLWVKKANAQAQVDETNRHLKTVYKRDIADPAAFCAAK